MGITPPRSYLDGQLKAEESYFESKKAAQDLQSMLGIETKIIDEMRKLLARFEGNRKQIDAIRARLLEKPAEPKKAKPAFKKSERLAANQVEDLIEFFKEQGAAKGWITIPFTTLRHKGFGADATAAKTIKLAQEKGLRVFAQKGFPSSRNWYTFDPKIETPSSRPEAMKAFQLLEQWGQRMRDYLVSVGADEQWVQISYTRFYEVGFKNAPTVNDALIAAIEFHGLRKQIVGRLGWYTLNDQLSDRIVTECVEAQAVLEPAEIDDLEPEQTVPLRPATKAIKKLAQNAKKKPAPMTSDLEAIVDRLQVKLLEVAERHGSSFEIQIMRLAQIIGTDGRTIEAAMQSLADRGFISFSRERNRGFIITMEGI